MRHSHPDHRAATAEAVVAEIAPRSLSGRAMLLGWAAALALVMAGLVASFTITSPIYAPGSGTVLQTDAGPRMLVFLPARLEPDLVPGDTVTLRSAVSTGAYTVTEVDPEPRSPEEIAETLTLSQAAANQIVEPVVIVHVAIPNRIGGVPAEEYAGAVFSASATIGERRVLPSMVEQFFNPERQGGMS